MQIFLPVSDGYEVNLDKHKLKTPLGKLFKVPTEALALAVATEWNAQQSVIKRHTMSLVIRIFVSCIIF